MGKTHQHFSYMLLKIFTPIFQYVLNISITERKGFLEMPQKNDFFDFSGNSVILRPKHIFY